MVVKVEKARKQYLLFIFILQSSLSKALFICKTFIGDIGYANVLSLSAPHDLNEVDWNGIYDVWKQMKARKPLPLG